MCSAAESIAGSCQSDEPFTIRDIQFNDPDIGVLILNLEPLGEREARLTITEGRYHQVRRMFAAVGNHVTGLHRDRIGGLELPEGLERGAWRILTDEEQAAIFA